MADRLVRSVSEGLSYVRHVDKTMDIKRNLTNSKDAADEVWYIGRLLYQVTSMKCFSNAIEKRKKSV
ncbi:hypothetical protein ACSBR2_030667 [Camellia fascicularis]